MTKTNHSVSSMEAAAAHIREQAGPDAGTVLVGPALVYGEDDLGLVVVSGPPGASDFIKLGTFLPDPAGPLYDAADSVLVLQRGCDVTIEDGRKMRDNLIAELRQHFNTVRLFDCDKELAIAYADTFPSEESRRIARDVLDGDD